MKDNRGITLVELLVSMAIFSIVAAILASIVNMAIKFYSSEKVDAGMQYESQIALNMVMDGVMQTNGIAIVNDTITRPDVTGSSASVEVTKGLFLGRFYTVDSKYHFAGRVILGDYDNRVLYVVEYADFEGEADVNSTMNKIATEFNGKSDTEKKSHLLAECVDVFLIEPAPGSISSGDASSGGPVFFHPFSVDITLVMEARTQGGIETQRVTDRAMIRNTLDVVYYGGDDYAEY